VGELEMRRKGEAPAGEKFFLLCYRLLSGYGMRWFRPLGIWIFILLMAIVGFSGLKFEGGGGKTLDLWQSFIHAMQVGTVLPRPTVTIPEGTAVDVLWGLWQWRVEFVELLLRLLSPFFLFLFGQAVRNSTRA
jgi:hypothetical protein